MIKLETSIYTPIPKNKKEAKKAEEIISSFGQETLNIIQTLEYIKRELGDGGPRKPHIMWQIIKAFINALSTQDPLQIHFDIVRKTLQKIEPDLSNDHQAIDSIARALNDCFKTLNLALRLPKEFEDLYSKAKQESDQSLTKENENTSHLLIILECPVEVAGVDSLFEENGVFIWDAALLAFLKLQGKEGRKAHTNLRSHLQEEFEDYKTSKKNALGLWFNLIQSQGEPFYISNICTILTKVLLEDKVRRNISFRDKNVPALTNKMHKPVIQITSPNKSIVKAENKEEIQLYHLDQLLASIRLPLANPQIIQTIMKGTEELCCLTAHRFLRHCIQTPFVLHANGIRDYKTIRYEGGYKELARNIGLLSKKDITKLKNISTALNYLEFETEEIQSRLINVGHFKSKKSNRYDGLEITILSPLLPYRIFEDGGLLIPLLKEPPLIGRPNEWAKQLLLQWMIAEIFTQKSIDLASHGYIEITGRKWGQLADNCKISKNLLQMIKRHWTQNEEKGFLEKKGKDFYTLGEEYKKELNFLREQGARRIKQTNRGKTSAEKRRARNP